MKRGFSLIEVVIVVLIAAAFLLLFAGLVSHSREMSRTISCINNMKQIAQAIENYQADWKDTPFILAALSPVYIPNPKTFHCPADRSSENSYENFYVNRPLYEEQARKILLACPRHFNYTRTVAAYLSYAVDIGHNKKVILNGTELSPSKFGQEVFSGVLKFADGTEAKVNEGNAGVLSSFVDNQGKLYSIIYVPEGQSGEKTEVEVTHQGDSQFEVITPSVIAGVAGTKFVVTVAVTDDETTTEVAVSEGKVNTALRAIGKLLALKKGEKVKEKNIRWPDDDGSPGSAVIRRKTIPRKPPRPRHVY
ncbi:MAG: FecR domain-containing protein [Candidatus Omnitrophica bacterium]|nr:FecR domain-containing protein [Candidatus Omnitrophota bacterium]